MIPTITYSVPTVTLIHSHVAPAYANLSSEHRVKVRAGSASNVFPDPHRNAVGEFSDAQAIYLRQLALRTAMRLGLDQDLAEDCAGQFIVFMLTPPRAVKLRDAFAQCSVGWLLRCAENWGLNYVRQNRALRAREVNWSSVQQRTEPDTGTSCPEWEPATLGGNPETELLRSELKSRIVAAVSLLAESQRYLFFRCFTSVEHAPELARGHGRSPGAIRNARWRLRKRLRRLLIEAGLTDEEVSSYLDYLNRS